MDEVEIRDSDWGKLTPEAQILAATLVGLRSGRTLNEAAERLGVVVEHVRDTIEVDDNGKVSGKKGTVTLTLEVAPNLDNWHGEVLTVSEKLAHRYPEDRSHPLYVGKRGTLHLRQDTTDMLFSVEGGKVVEPGDDDPHRQAAQAD